MYFGTVFLKDSYLRDMYSMPCLLCSLAVFALFLNLKIDYSGRINRMAAFCFGIFLFQAHSGSEQVLWQTLLRSSVWAERKVFVLWSVLAALLICCIGILLGTVWQRLSRFCQKTIRR